MRSRHCLAPVHHLAAIDRVRDGVADHVAGPGLAARIGDPPRIEVIRDPLCRFERDVAAEYPSYDRRLRFMGHQLVGARRLGVAKRALLDPQAALASAGKPVLQPFAGQLALELGKAQQDIEREAAHGRAGVKGLRDRDKRDAASLELRHQVAEIPQRPRQAVDFVDHDGVQFPQLDVGAQPVQRRALQGSARISLIVIAVRQLIPALAALAGDVGGAKGSLIFQRPELGAGALVR